MNNKFKIAACIVTYKNPPEEVILAARSFLSSDLAVTLTIVDNGSGHHYLDHFKNSFSAQFIQTRQNRGFAHGHNIGLKNAPPCEYYLVMNPDIIIQPGALGKLAEFLDENTDIGLVVPRILDVNGALQIAYKQLPSVLDLLIRRLPKKLRNVGFIEKRLNWLEMKNADYQAIFDVPFVSGCFMLFRKSLLDQIGGFDDRYFMYFEDVDLSRRVWEKSRAVYFPHASITHRWRGGARQDLRLFWYLIKSSIMYFHKWGWKWY